MNIWRASPSTNFIFRSWDAKSQFYKDLTSICSTISRLLVQPSDESDKGDFFIDFKFKSGERKIGEILLSSCANTSDFASNQFVLETPVPTTISSPSKCYIVQSLKITYLLNNIFDNFLNFLNLWKLTCWTQSGQFTSSPSPFCTRVDCNTYHVEGRL